MAKNVKVNRQMQQDADIQYCVSYEGMNEISMRVFHEFRGFLYEKWNKYSICINIMDVLVL